MSPNGDSFRVSVYLDPANPPKAVMLQFNVGGWNHRASGAMTSAIPFGTVGTPERVHVGASAEGRRMGDAGGRPATSSA